MDNTKTIHINNLSFDKTISHGLVIVDFWAEWCAPCRMQSAILDQLAQKSKGKFRIAKLNVDDNREIAARFGISSIPTLLIFRDAKLTLTLIGLRSEAELMREVSLLSPQFK